MSILINPSVRFYFSLSRYLSGSRKSSIVVAIPSLIILTGKFHS